MMARPHTNKRTNVQQASQIHSGSEGEPKGFGLGYLQIRHPKARRRSGITLCRDHKARLRTRKSGRGLVGRSQLPSRDLTCGQTRRQMSHGILLHDKARCALRHTILRKMLVWTPYILV